MKRLWVFFTDRQLAAIEAEANRQNLPKGEVVRRGVTRYFGLEPEHVEAGRPYKSPELAAALGGDARELTGGEHA